MRVRAHRSDGRRSGGQLTGPKDIGRWLAWRRTRDKRIAGKPKKEGK